MTVKGKPVIHRLDDPTGLAGVRASCLAEMRKRCRKSQEQVKLHVKDWLRQRERTIEVNALELVYDVEPDEVAALEDDILAIINAYLLASVPLSMSAQYFQPQARYTWSQQWWMNSYDTTAFTRGTSDSMRSIKGLSHPSVVGAEIAATVHRLVVDDVIAGSFDYQRRLKAELSESFANMKGFTSDTAKAATRVVTQGAKKGKTYRSIAGSLNNVFDDMAGYRSRRIVRTELNRIKNNAYSENTKAINSSVFGETDFAVMVMHLSVLAPNTRLAHGRRHGTVSTPDEQAEWWDEGANRINCQCSITDVMVNKSTGEVLQTKAHERALEEGEAFFAMDG